MTEDRLYQLIERQVMATTELISRQEKFLEQVLKVTDDHEKRIRLIERVIGFGTGFAGAVVIVVKLLGR